MKSSCTWLYIFYISYIVFILRAHYIFVHLLHSAKICIARNFLRFTDVVYCFMSVSLSMLQCWRVHSKTPPEMYSKVY